MINMYYFGILVLTVLSVGNVQSECGKEGSQKILREIKQLFYNANQDFQYGNLYKEMDRRHYEFTRNLLMCDDTGKLQENWNKLKNNLLDKIKKSCPDFESTYGEIKYCRENLDFYHFNKDENAYCRVFEKCLGIQEHACPALKSSALLKNPQSKAVSNLCTIECDDLLEFWKVLLNCWASVRVLKKSSQKFEFFSDCVVATTKPTCRVTKRNLSKIFPLFDDNANEFSNETVSEKPESKCIQEWKVLKDIEDLKPSMCSMLEDMRSCITKFLKGDDKKYKEKVAKCQYSVVNLIKTEALHQTTKNPTSVPSTASGKWNSGPYHLSLLFGLVTYFTKMI